MLTRNRAHGFEKIQQAAQAALETNFNPPARYGTAFHLNLPVADVRQLTSEAGNMNLEAWERLTKENQQIILNLDLADAYLTWHLANITTPVAVGDHPSFVRRGNSSSFLPLTKGESRVRQVGGRGKGVKLGTQIIHIPANQSQSLSLNQTGKSSQLVFIVLDEGAKLTIEDTIMRSEFAIRRMFVWQKENSSFSFTGLRANTEFLNEKLRVELLGQEAKTRITHLTYGQASEQYDLAVEAYHRSPQATSQLHVRSAASQKSKTIYRGLIDVDQAAAGTNGYQSGRALLLARQAVVDQLPKLAIRTNDVRCSHGVTTTHLDDQSLFYLRSRGLPETEAKRLAMTGFFHHQLDIPAKIRKSLAHALA